MLAILYGSEAWCLKKSNMSYLLSPDGSMVRTVCGVQLIDRKRSKALMLGLSEAIDQLGTANSVCCYGNVLRREDVYVLRRELNIEVEGQWKNRGPKITWKKLVEEESVNVGSCIEDSLFLSEWSVGVNLIAIYVEVNLANFSCWGYYHVLNICSFPPLSYYLQDVIHQNAAKITNTVPIS